MVGLLNSSSCIFLVIAFKLPSWIKIQIITRKGLQHNKDLLFDVCVSDFIKWSYGLLNVYTVQSI